MPHDAEHDDGLYLADIVEAAQTIERWMEIRGGDWDDDEILRNAVLRQLLVIGEASSALSDSTREALSAVPWQQVRGFRNHAVHAYFSIDWQIVYETATADLTNMSEAVRSLLKSEYPDIAKRLDNTDEA